MRNVSLITLLLSGTVLAGCSLAPDFVLPDTGVPNAYKEQLPDTQGELARGKWKEASAMETEDRGQWWKMFGDAQLDALEQEAIDANQSLKAAAARVEQSRALAEGVRPSYLPDLDIGGNAVRAKPSGAALAAFGNSGVRQINPYNMYVAQGVLSYEADLFGSVRDNYKAYMFDSRAQEASYRSALLALQADVASHYYAIRALDAERQLLRDTVAIREEAARIMQRRYDVGAVSEIDTTRTQSDLAGTRAELIVLDTQRRQLENALAVLLGKMPSEYEFAEAPLTGMPPLIPAGLPSELLERRPDIAASIASMEAANKRIGVARTAFFPRLILTSSGGYQSTQLGNLFDWSSRTWALGQTAGSALAMSIFDSGRNFAQLDASKSAYKEAVANYQQQVLAAFRDVEDNLTAQRLLAEQSEQQQRAADAASRTTELVNKRYDQGDVDYFQVVDAQRVSVSSMRAAAQVKGQRYLATIGLIRALGGGWDMAALQPQPAETPDAASVQPDAASSQEPEQQPVLVKAVPAEEDNAVQPDTIIEPQLPLTEEEQPAKPVIVLGPQTDDLSTDAEDATADEEEVGAEEDDQPVTIAPFFESQFGKDSVSKSETDDGGLPDARLMPESPSPAPENNAPVLDMPVPNEGNGGNDWFDIDIETVPAGEALKDKQSRMPGTVLNGDVPPAGNTVEQTAAEPMSFDFDWNVEMDVVPAGEALKGSNHREAIMGTTLETAPKP
jgi:outer membrane protein, multidrug efflux system